MPTKTESKGFQLQVIGKYISMNEHGTKTEKPYSEKFILPELTDDKGNPNALLTVVKYLLEPRLQRRHPDYQDFLTHTIIEVTDLDDPENLDLDVEYLSRKQILDQIRKKKWPIQVELFSDIAALRQAVKDYISNPTMFLQHQAAKAAGDHSRDDEARYITDLNELNKHLEPDPKDEF